MAMAEKQPSVDEAVEVFPDLSWTVPRLKAFLKQHGGFLSGKKAELLERYAICFVCDSFRRGSDKFCFLLSMLLQCSVLQE